MVSNLSQITDAINNLNVTIQAIDVENIIPIAIESTNQTTQGWLGITVFIIFSIAVLSHLMANKSSFQIFNNLNLVLVSMSIWIDLSIQLLLFGILASVQIFTFLYVAFFAMCVISFLKKELLSPE